MKCVPYKSVLLIIWIEININNALYQIVFIIRIFKPIHIRNVGNDNRKKSVILNHFQQKSNGTMYGNLFYIQFNNRNWYIFITCAWTTTQPHLNIVSGSISQRLMKPRKTGKQTTWFLNTTTSITIPEWVIRYIAMEKEHQIHRNSHYLQIKEQL